MLKFIRNIKFGWIIIAMGIVTVLTGVSMAENEGEGTTLLCFDKGCIYVQGISNIVLGALFIVVGIYLCLRK